MLTSVLAAVDLSPSSDRVWSRVAKLPLAPDAQVTLLHVVPKELAGSAQLRAVDDATDALRAITSRGPKALRDAATLVLTGEPSKRIGELVKKHDVELVALGRGPGRAFRDRALGSTAERVLRAGLAPVLVVRKPTTHSWAQPLAALDVDVAAARAVKFAGRFFEKLDVVHATSAPFRGPLYPSLGDDYARAYETKHLRTRLAELKRLIKRARPGVAVKFHGRHGPARAVVPAAVREFDVDLLILGTHARSQMGAAILGSVAGDLLREVTCDVLVVPAREV
ncbi:MAG: universal stress protein [Archangium sp.]